MQWVWEPLTESDMQMYRDLCPDDQYRVIESPEKLPGVSDGLLAKCPKMMLAASGDPSGRVFYMANLYRLDPDDKKGKAVDQHPFGFVIDTGNPLNSGVLTHHGNWDGRTTYPSVSQWEEVINGQYAAYKEMNITPNCMSGSIDDLTGTSSQGAFATVIRKLSRTLKIQDSSGPNATPGG